MIIIIFFFNFHKKNDFKKNKKTSFLKTSNCTVTLIYHQKYRYIYICNCKQIAEEKHLPLSDDMKDT